MKKAMLLSALTFGLFNACDSPPKTTEVTATGPYSGIEVTKHNETIATLSKGSNKQKKEAIAAVLADPDSYNPPVLYALSRAMFRLGDKDDAAFWFYVGQLRARYDAERCRDNSAKQAVPALNQEYGGAINKYTFQDINKLSETVQRAVAYVRGHPENYDHRWINLHGMRAMQSGLSGEADDQPMSAPESEWPAIKKQTIDDYYADFQEFVLSRSDA